MTARFSPDGKQIVYAGSLKGSQSPHHKQLLTIEHPFRSGSRAKPNILLQSDKITPSHIGVSGSSLEWADDGKSVYFLAAQKGVVPLWRITSKNKRLRKVIEGEFEGEFEVELEGGKKIIYQCGRIIVSRFLKAPS